MTIQASQKFRKIFGAFLIAAVIGVFNYAAQAAKLSPTLQNKLTTVADNVSVGMVIVTFNTTSGLQPSHLNVLQSVGVTGGQTFPTLGIVAQPMTAGQVRALANNPAVRATAKFNDVSGDFARIAEAVTANGSTNRDYNFAPKGLLSFTGTTFNRTGTVSRLDMAVAFVRALGHDDAARAKANQPVIFNGAALSDNAQIPGELRGYVQLAIDKVLFEAFPAEVRNVGGQFVVLPGPRFEPNTTVTRATLATKLNSFNQLFTTGG